jgi:hypothetical protein
MVLAAGVVSLGAANAAHNPHPPAASTNTATATHVHTDPFATADDADGDVGGKRVGSAGGAAEGSGQTLTC